MSLANYRTALIVAGETPTQAVVIAGGEKGDQTLAENPTWVEVTGMDPMPGVGNGWTYVNGGFVPPPVPEPTRESVEVERRLAYAAISDPLFFEWQRGDATEQEWRDAVQAVKDAHPYPTPPGE